MNTTVISRERKVITNNITNIWVVGGPLSTANTPKIAPKTHPMNVTGDDGITGFGSLRISGHPVHNRSPHI
jgi:hypothetical protein